MPTPIVLPQRRSPWETYLPALFLQKIQHKQDMEREEIRIKARESQMKAQHTADVNKRRGKLLEKGYKPTGSEKGAIYFPGAEESYIPPKNEIYTDPRYPGMIFNASPTGGITMQNLPSKSTSEKNTPFKLFVSGYKKDKPNATDTEIANAWSNYNADMQGKAGAKRYEGLAKSRKINVYDTERGRFITTNQGFVNEANARGELGRYLDVSVAKAEVPEVADKYAYFEAKKAFARVPANQRASSIIASSKLLDKEVPEIIKLRYKVESEGALPESAFKDINKLNQWLGEKTSNPDLALLRKKVLLLSESLQRIMGSSQGGEWAFNVSKDILDPSFSGAAFERIANSHARMLRRLAMEYVNFKQTVTNPNFGQESIQEQPQSNTPKVGTIDGGYIFQGGNPADSKNWRKVK